MSYIFLDESGDLGFDWSKSKTSKYFIITALFTVKKTNLDKIVKRVFKSFSKKEIRRHKSVLHSYNELPKTRIKLLKMLATEDVSVITIYLNKKKVYTDLKNERHVLYNYVANILLDRIFTKKLIPITGKIELIASRRETNKFLNLNFKNYLEQQARQKHQLNLKVEIRQLHEDKSLQIVDFVCWTIFRKYEHSDDSYIEIIKSKIVQENPLFP